MALAADLMSALDWLRASLDMIAMESGLEDPVLHMHAGLAILLAASLIARWPLAGFRPFAVVVAAEAINEALDFFFGSPALRGMISDIAYTLFWPFVLSLFARWWPSRLGATPARSSKSGRKRW